MHTVAEHLADPSHGGSLEGADATGEASAGPRLRVRIALWLEGERARRARYRCTTCAALIAYSEAACALLEAGAPPARVDGAALRALVAGVHPIHGDRADLVAEAIRAAAAPGGET